MKNGYRWIFIWLALSLMILSACSEEPIPPPPKIVFTRPTPPLRIGLSDSASALEELASIAYEQDPGQADLQFIVGNDQTLLADLDSGRLDAVIVYTVPESGDWWFNPIALDGLLFFSHPEIILSDIGLQELKALFSGTVMNWSAFNLPESPVVLFSRESGSGAEATFDTKLMGGGPVAPTSLIAISEIDMVASVTSTSGAAGYRMMGSAESHTGLTIDGIQASPGTTADQTYPLTVPIYFVSEEEPSGDLRILLSNLQSETGQSIIGEKYGRLR